MKLFQYWNDGAPPLDVAGWAAGWRADNPQLEHVLLDEVSAAAFVARHYGPRETAAFRACAVPAMQADYLRLCLMEAEGGLYLDVDQQSAEPLVSLLDKTPNALMPKFLEVIGNNVLVFREPRHPFVTACLQLATDNILERRFESVLASAGPALITAVRCIAEPAVREPMAFLAQVAKWDAWGWAELLARAEGMIAATPELLQAYGRIKLMQMSELSRWVDSEVAAYKSGPSHWPNWKGSIYR